MAESSELAEIATALGRHNAKITLVRTFTHGVCAQVWAGAKKAGPLIIPNRADGQSLGDVLHMLGTLAEGGQSNDE